MQIALVIPRRTIEIEENNSQLLITDALEQCNCINSIHGKVCMF